MYVGSGYPADFPRASSSGPAYAMFETKASSNICSFIGTGLGNRYDVLILPPFMLSCQKAPTKHDLSSASYMGSETSTKTLVDRAARSVRQTQRLFTQTEFTTNGRTT